MLTILGRQSRNTLRYAKIPLYAFESTGQYGLRRQTRAYWGAFRGTACLRSKTLSDTYQPTQIEERRYAWWEQQGLFKPRSNRVFIDNLSKDDQSFTMIIPPPNVTGFLHIGHALTAYLQDTIIRWHRMCGKDVQWIPGTDHASIATQSVVERQLWREQQLRRTDMSREEFLKHVWQWKNKCGDRIYQQLRRIGASLDWDNSFFTMDQIRSEAVVEAFCRMHEDGVIYRDTRLVNWCCALSTVISDIEIEYEEIPGRTLISLPGRSEPVEFGVLHKLAYPLADGQGELVVGTTRIETMLADCALAVHPDDARYKHLHGKSVVHPIHGRELPIITDASLVDPEFGTGVVKVTPAHDANDYACARRHNLPMISMINKDGTLNENCGVAALVGKDRYEARSIVTEMLQQRGAYRGADTQHAMRIARCSRSGDIIEPLIQPQWYIKCASLAKRVLDDLERRDQYDIIPAQYEAEWRRWLDGIHDWCVSRQLWWGHRIPAYRILLPEDTKQEEHWVVGRNLEEAQHKAKQRLAELGYPSTTTFELKQDEDVLDTWFSSALLPLSALGWTGKNAIPSRYPLDLMETGADILFFWVARMSMLCTYFAGSTPFKRIALHPMVRDAQGRKMSKSLGNVIDPLYVIEGVPLATLEENIRTSNLSEAEKKRSLADMRKQFPEGIPPCGSDALRFSLLLATQQTRQVNMDVYNIVSASHFANKIWNLAKFTFGRLDALTAEEAEQLKCLLQKPPHIDQDTPLVNRYLLSRLARTTRAVNVSLQAWRIHEAATEMRRFLVEDLCDTYIEYTKPVLNSNETNLKLQSIYHLVFALEAGMRLLHPMMPFVTEEIWQVLISRYEVLNKQPGVSSIMISAFPTFSPLASLIDDDAEQNMEMILSVVHASRSLRQTHQISALHKLPFFIWTSLAKHIQPDSPLSRYAQDIKAFTNASQLTLVAEETLVNHPDLKEQLNSSLAMSVRPDLKVFLPVSAIPDRGGLSKRFRRKLDGVERELSRLVTRMERPEYATRTPAHVQEKDSERRALLEEQQRDLTRSIALFEAE